MGLDNKLNTIIPIAIGFGFFTFFGALAYLGYKSDHQTAQLKSASQKECELKDGTYLPREGVCLDVGHIRIGGDTSQISVIVYGTDWCEYCKDAATYLQRRGIKYVEKNVEQDKMAAAEMHFMLDHAKLERGLIPVIFISSPNQAQVLRGYERQDLKDAIEAQTVYKE